ncbi:50S ribosomal protein L10 [Candidatus Woesearchaeota archaeon]|nr:50S ribosomal protein L10 [Candidatus Woesearchaeota archaeon]
MSTETIHQDGEKIAAEHAESQTKPQQPSKITAVHKAHIATVKKTVVKELEGLCRKYSIVGIVNMQNLPTKQLQNMRESMRGQVLIRMSKQRLIKIALNDLEKEKKGISLLSEYFRGMPALLFTEENPFTLFQNLKKNKSKAPIKGGQTAPNDIVVKAGPTDFAPGPVIGELGGFGIQTGVEGGKVAIKKDRVVAKEGDVVSNKLAGLLTRLGIEPMEIGLDLVAVYEKGDILLKKVLDIDPDEYRQNMVAAATESFNLAFNTSFPTTDTIGPLVVKAVAEARAVAYSQDILADEIVPDLMLKAYNQALSVAGHLPADAMPVETATAKSKPAETKAPENKPEGPKQEEKKREEGREQAKR